MLGPSLTRAYHVGRGNDDLQLLLQATIQLKNGQKRDISILVDTGAQTNLIREGVVPSYLTKVSQRPFELVAANGHPIPGGDRETRVTLFFAKTEATGQK